MKTLIASLITVAGLIAGAVLYRGHGGAEAMSGDFAVEHLAVPEVTLTDQEGNPQPLPGPITAGRTVVVNFNYTTCQSICPIGNDIMAQLDSLLPADAPVSLLSVTIDPSRDTPQMMRRAAQEFGVSSRWHWLTGEVGEVRQLLEAFDADAYDLELHDPIFLVGDFASGRFHRSLSMPSADELAALVERARR